MLIDSSLRRWNEENKIRFRRENKTNLRGNRVSMIFKLIWQYLLFKTYTAHSFGSKKVLCFTDRWSRSSRLKSLKRSSSHEFQSLTDKRGYISWLIIFFSPGDDCMTLEMGMTRFYGIFIGKIKWTGVEEFAESRLRCTGREFGCSFGAAIKRSIVKACKLAKTGVWVGKLDDRPFEKQIHAIEALSLSWVPVALSLETEGTRSCDKPVYNRERGRERAET